MCLIIYYEKSYFYQHHHNHHHLLFLRIGLYQIHWPTPLANEGYWDGLARCYNRGTCYVLIKMLYISNKRVLCYVYLYDDDDDV